MGANATINGITVTGGNEAGGGGINNNGTLSLNNSTVSSNSVTNGSGGGISNSSSGTTTLNNSTVSGNSAPIGGGISNSPSGTTTLNNSIIANNTSGRDCSGTVNASFSLIEDGSCGVINGVNNNLTGDPNLGPLQNNGGPTFTHALLLGSIAIDAGNNALIPAGITTDQRGQNRIIDGDNNGSAIVDIGSFEALAPTAAPAGVSGRVYTGTGRGIIRRVYISLTDTFTSITRSTQTNQFGYFRFEEVEVGHFYIIKAVSKNFVFTPDNYTFQLLEDRENVDFTGVRISKTNQ